ncbi:hypothetical protein EMCRGX_G033462 [Ephydatia muelleri]
MLDNAYLFLANKKENIDLKIGDSDEEMSTMLDWHPSKVLGTNVYQQPVKLWNLRAGLSACKMCPYGAHPHLAVFWPCPQATVMCVKWKLADKHAARDHLIRHQRRCQQPQDEVRPYMDVYLGAPPMIASFPAGGNLTALVKTMQDSSLDIRPIVDMEAALSIKFRDALNATMASLAENTTSWKNRLFQNSIALYKLTQKTVHQSFNWTEQCTVAFEELKKKLTTPPIQAFPRFDREFLLAIDASDSAIGAVLSQVHDNGTEKVIAYWSRQL